MIIKVERMFRFEEAGQPLKAFVDISIDNALLIKGLRIVQGQRGLFVSMPQEQGKDHRWYEIMRCMTSEIKEVLTAIVLSSYNGEDSQKDDDENDVIIP